MADRATSGQPTGSPHWVLKVTALEAVAGRIVTILRGLGPSGPATEITASVGVAVGDGHSSAEDLLADADDAAYRAKATGRDRFVTKHTDQGRLRPSRS
jgi:PleD family two-component response regulator